jgi:hypothetical protein
MPLIHAANRVEKDGALSWALRYVSGMATFDLDLFCALPGFGWVRSIMSDVRATPMLRKTAIARQCTTDLDRLSYSSGYIQAESRAGTKKDRRLSSTEPVPQRHGGSSRLIII